MQITFEKIINKIDIELQQVKASDSNQRVREGLYAIKALCELALSEQHEIKEARASIKLPTTTQSRKVDDAGGGDGDSLFDF